VRLRWNTRSLFAAISLSVVEANQSESRKASHWIHLLKKRRNIDRTESLVEVCSNTFYRSPASRKRRRKGNRVLGDINTGTWPSTLGSLESERVKCGHESCRTRTRE
jgi:hypothetical protein